jgi:uncharacterized protein
MFNKGDESFLSKPKRVPWSVVEAVPSMIWEHHERTGQEDFRLCLHGGEPLLIGKAYFDEMMSFLNERLSGLSATFSLQTNAVLVDDEWCALFLKHDVCVAASLDGPPSVNGKNRRFLNGKDSSPEAIEGIRCIQRSGANFGGVICVVQPEARGDEVVRFFVEDLELHWFDFLLPDYCYEDIPTNWSEVQLGLSAFMRSAFDAWFPYSASGVSCRFFDSIIARLVGLPSKVDTVGMDGVGSIIIETDGTLEPHDTLRVCHSVDRRTGITVGPGALNAILDTPIFRLARNQQKEFSPTCLSCGVFDKCRGGHMVHRFSSENGFKNPSVHCNVLKDSIIHVQKRIGSALLSTPSNCARPRI